MGAEYRIYILDCRENNTQVLLRASIRLVPSPLFVLLILPWHLDLRLSGSLGFAVGLPGANKPILAAGKHRLRLMVVSWIHAVL